ncbi:MAG: ATP-binding protein [Deltaproteobacteria bacterium]|nr:ATP-binding protein [Deltaproteobacteria bacterium]
MFLRDYMVVIPGWVFFLIVLGIGILITSVTWALILKRRVEDRTKKLKMALEKAQEADRLKSAFLAAMSHELRTPLNSIIGFTGILLKGLAGPLNEEQKRQLLMVKESSQHLLALINDILDISKIEAGELKLFPSRFDLRASLEKLIGMCRHFTEKKGLYLEFNITEGVHEVIADQKRLEQVLINLLTNAVKFTEKGGITVTCTADQKNYIISVKDTGIGINGNYLPLIFEPFRQIDSGLSRKYEGTGLGLSISKRLIEMMGGKIFVESEPGKGSNFTVVLPKNMEGQDEKESSLDRG